MGESPSNLIVFEGTVDAFHQRIADHSGLVVVEFGSTKCQPCRRIRQVFPGFAKANSATLFLIVEVDTFPDFATQFGISSVPVIKYFKGVKDGKAVELASVAGADVPAIKEKITALAQN
jgi:thioredoxin-like negative regulator of GroEL